MCRGSGVSPIPDEGVSPHTFKWCFTLVLCGIGGPARGPEGNPELQPEKACGYCFQNRVLLAKGKSGQRAGRGTTSTQKTGVTSPRRARNAFYTPSQAGYGDERTRSLRARIEVVDTTHCTPMTQRALQGGWLCAGIF